jgi:hypothetical protein
MPPTSEVGSIEVASTGSSVRWSRTSNLYSDGSVECIREPTLSKSISSTCPIEICDNIQIDRCRIYPLATTEDAYRGPISSKRRFFYGLKVHMVTIAEGVPVEVSLTPGNHNDTKHLRSFELDLPEGSVLYGDKAYNEYFAEDILAEACDTELLPHRKENLKWIKRFNP